MTEFADVAHRDIDSDRLAELSVAEYDQAEYEAMAELPNRAIMAFQPVVFHQLGYPCRVRRESELFKYLDVMHDLRFEGDFRHLLGGLTREEFDLVKRLTTRIVQFSESRFQRRALARASVLRSLNVLRHIRYLYGERRPRVFEVGPGCGYLGTLLMLEGYPYAATDVAQAFYLYQNWLWNFLAGGRVIELVRTSDREPSWPDGISAGPPGGAVHVPWWEFVRRGLRSGASYDLVICNHALCEMHPDSLAFTVKSAKRLLASPDGMPKAFAFEGWGARHERLSEITERFYRAGFIIVHSDTGIIVFALRDAPEGRHGLGLPFHHLPLKRRYVRRVRHVLRRGLSMLRCALWELPLADRSYEPCEYASPENPFSRAIQSGRQAQQHARTITLDQVKRFYAELLASEDDASPDERFLLDIWSG